MKIEKRPINREANVYKPSRPFLGKVVSSSNLLDAPNDEVVKKIVLDLSGSGMRYVAGQSLGVIPPGEQSKGKRHKPRLYSIASGGVDNPERVELCVKLSTWSDEASGESGVGLCSNYLCSLAAGDELLLTGPTGRSFLLPVDLQDPLFLFSVGTGIAPYKAFFEQLQQESPELRPAVHFFFGARYSTDLLYMNQANQDISSALVHYGVEPHLAISREQSDAEGNKIYIAHRLEESMDKLWPIIATGRFCLYICGLKGMEKGLDSVLASRAAAAGQDWESMKKEFKAQGRWNVEVY